MRGLQTSCSTGLGLLVAAAGLLVGCSCARSEELHYATIERLKVERPTGARGDVQDNLDGERVLADYLSWTGEVRLPLLLPVDDEVMTRRPAGGKREPGAGDPEAFERHLKAGVRRIELVQSGPAGYDVRLISSIAGKPRSVTLTATALVYSIPGVDEKGEAQSIASPLGTLTGRALVIEDERRFAFTAFGVAYALSAYCSQDTRDADGCARERALVEAVAGELRVVSWGAGRARLRSLPEEVWRPRRRSRDFTYFPPGDLEPGTGGGRADATVYARLRFPFRRAPAFANSQVFRDGGNCLDGSLNLNGDVPASPLVEHGGKYTCHITGRSLTNNEGASQNYDYPWRDNFCEQRGWSVAACPSGHGHQGQDIRPPDCDTVPWKAGKESPTAMRCRPFRHAIVAVAGGTIQRFDGTQTVNLYVNSSTENYRVRYLHMDPDELDRGGIANGRKVARGEVLGKAGNYLDGPFGTSTHLHFELSVPTRMGWVRVNPYMSLVVAYEGLIRGRGRLVTPRSR